MRVIAVNRGLSRGGVFLAGKWGTSEQPTWRWPDKSTAVGRGACGCLYWGFRAAPAVTQTALASKPSTNSKLDEPSPVRGLGNAPR
jgi:hypothetical protein